MRTYVGMHIYICMCSYGLISPFSQTQCVCLCFLKFSWCWFWFCSMLLFFLFFASVCLIFLFCIWFRWPRNWVESRKMKCWRDERRWITAAVATTSVVAATTARAGAGAGTDTAATFKLWHTQIFQHNALCHISVCAYMYAIDICFLYTLSYFCDFAAFRRLLHNYKNCKRFRDFPTAKFTMKISLGYVNIWKTAPKFTVSLKTKFFSCA